MLHITNYIKIPDSEIEMSAIRSQGSGGQNVNKVATAIHLKFDINESSLSDFNKTKLISLNDHHITNDGIIIIKAQRFRTQEKNKQDALSRLAEIIKKITIFAKPRRATKPSKSSQKKRLDSKTKRKNIKAMRGKYRGE